MIVLVIHNALGVRVQTDNLRRHVLPSNSCGLQLVQKIQHPAISASLPGSISSSVPRFTRLWRHANKFRAAKPDSPCSSSQADEGFLAECRREHKVRCLRDVDGVAENPLGFAVYTNKTFRPFCVTKNEALSLLPFSRRSNGRRCDPGDKLITGLIKPVLRATWSQGFTNGRIGHNEPFGLRLLRFFWDSTRPIFSTFPKPNSFFS